MKIFSIVTNPVLAFRLYRFAWKRKHQPTLGFQIGDVGRAATDLHPEGYINLAGEIWPAEAPHLIEQGSSIRVIGSTGARLRVERLNSLTDIAKGT
ncbi:MAG: NfeD family protein [Blastocatellia bacterium]|nr:NfeD family protein [Blastocatellia bacterium]